jgi:hypothetical protein
MSEHGQLPEETDTHFRPAGVLQAIRYLGGVVTGKSAKRDAKLLEQLTVLLNDHLRLEGEVIRLAGIVRRTNKLEREKWETVYPFGVPKSETSIAKSPNPWDQNVPKYQICIRCRGVLEVSSTDFRNEVVSIDGKPYCKPCKNVMASLRIVDKAVAK